MTLPIKTPPRPEQRESTPGGTEPFINGDRTISQYTYSLCERVIDEAMRPIGEQEFEARHSIIQGLLDEMAFSIIDYANSDPANDPSLVRERIISAFRELPGEWHVFESQRLTDINSAIKRYNPNLARVRDLGLDPYDQICLMKAAALAGIVRGTHAGGTMANGIITSLSHEVHNPIALYHSLLSQDVAKFIKAFQRGVFASAALNEIRDRQQSSEFKNVDDCLLNWRALADSIAMDHSAVPNVVGEDGEPIGEGDTQFRELTDVEIDGRIATLELIGEKITEIFGASSTVRIFETIVFDGIEQRGTGSGFDESQDEDETSESDEENEDSQQNGGPFRDYVVAEITQHMSDGTTHVHVVAESTHPNNACYVLRSDVLLEVSKLVGRDMTWRDVFKHRKNTARQLGARDFRHTKNGDLTGKVLHHFNSPVQSVLRQIAIRWIAGRKKIYDEIMEPTKYNRLPFDIRHFIDANKQSTLETLLAWLAPLLGASETSKHIGSSAIGQTIPEAKHTNPSEVDELRRELEDLRASLDKSERENENLRRQLDAIRGIVSW